LVETGGLVITVVDPTAATIGKATLSKAGSGSDGKNVQVSTKAVTAGSKIFTSFENNPGSSSWVEKIKDSDTGDYVGFKILLDQPTSEDIDVDWWIVEGK
ncbi:MAG: hypothetical protein WCJ25_03530, partial [Candidatus Moraniibacteriota bacterium]